MLVRPHRDDLQWISFFLFGSSLSTTVYDNSDWQILLVLPSVDLVHARVAVMYAGLCSDVQNTPAVDMS